MLDWFKITITVPKGKEYTEHVKMASDSHVWIYLFDKYAFASRDNTTVENLGQQELKQYKVSIEFSDGESTKQGFLAISKEHVVEMVYIAYKGRETKNILVTTW